MRNMNIMVAAAALSMASDYDTLAWEPPPRPVRPKPRPVRPKPRPVKKRKFKGSKAAKKASRIHRP